MVRPLRRRGGAALLAGILLVALGMLGILTLHLVEQAVQRHLAAPMKPLSRTSLIRTARASIKALFTNEEVVAVFPLAAPPPVPVASQGNVIVSAGPGQVLLVLGQGSRARFIAQETILPKAQGQLGATNEMGWHIPLIAPQGTSVQAVSWQGLSPALRSRYRTWAGYHPTFGLLPTSGLIAWPFPGGTLIVEQSKGQGYAVLFPADAAPTILQGPSI